MVGSYFLFFNNASEDDLDSNNTQTSKERETLEVEQDDLFTMESKNNTKTEQDYGCF